MAKANIANKITDTPPVRGGAPNPPFLFYTNSFSDRFFDAILFFIFIPMLISDLSE